uniref:Uncharacterized protein n=1 Tax=Anopheles maculatus TaxID=74869 RepID=A0A182SSD4_9DIPT
MTAEQYARIRAQDPRYRGSSTLPRATNRATETETLRSEKIATATSSTSLYDNVGANNTQGNTINSQETGHRQTKSQETSTMTNVGTVTGTSVTQNHVGSQIGQDESGQPMGNQRPEETSKSEGTQAGGTLQQPERSTKTT